MVHPTRTLFFLSSISSAIDDTSFEELTIQQLIHSISPSESPSIRNTPAQAEYLLMKQKYTTNPPRCLLNCPFTSLIHQSRHQRRHTNTLKYLLVIIPFFSQYCFHNEEP